MKQSFSGFVLAFSFLCLCVRGWGAPEAHVRVGGLDLLMESVGGTENHGTHYLLKLADQKIKTSSSHNTVGTYLRVKGPRDEVSYWVDFEFPEDMPGETIFETVTLPLEEGFLLRIADNTAADSHGVGYFLAASEFYEQDKRDGASVYLHAHYVEDFALRWTQSDYSPGTFALAVANNPGLNVPAWMDGSILCGYRFYSWDSTPTGGMRALIHEDKHQASGIAYVEV